MEFSIDQKYPNDRTTTISLNFTFDFKEFVITELPKICDQCPVGYIFNDDGENHIPCGRKSLKDKGCLFDSRLRRIRPKECKLRDIRQFIEELGMDELITLINQSNTKTKVKGGYHYGKEE